MIGDWTAWRRRDSDRFVMAREAKPPGAIQQAFQMGRRGSALLVMTIKALRTVRRTVTKEWGYSPKERGCEPTLCGNATGHSHG
jgi:hypothetical protein